MKRVSQVLPDRCDHSNLWWVAGEAYGEHEHERAHAHEQEHAPEPQRYSTQLESRWRNVRMDGGERERHTPALSGIVHHWRWDQAAVVIALAERCDLEGGTP